MDNVYLRKEDLPHWVTDYFGKQELISIDDLICYIEDLQEEVDEWKTNYEELERDLEDNYKPISKAEQYDVNECDFI